MEVITLTSVLGGELGETISKLLNQPAHCRMCSTDFDIEELKGYEHSGGLPDEKGRCWWLFTECPYCHYQWSFQKLPRILKEADP